MTHESRAIAESWSPAATLAERLSAGREVRATLPRRRLAQLTTAQRDPLGIIDAQNATRLPDLIPLRTQRMSQSPFAFYRGTAAIMASDLARDPHTGILVASCGDAHVSNFGFFASPQRTLLFDLNDFDEAAWAPWEWDLKRLVTSVVIGGQATSRADEVVRGAARSAVLTYARAIAAGARRSPLDRYFQHFDANATLAAMDRESRAVLKAAIREAKRRTGERAVRRITETDKKGRLSFVEDPPTLAHVEVDLELRVKDFLSEYSSTAREDIRILLRQYTISDIARRVVGVGSVGTRCYLVVFQDGEDNTMLLQAKQAMRSVLVEYGGIEQPKELKEVIAKGGEGARVVGLQRILQALSDPFLGHLRGPGGDFYARQFHDMKGGIEVEPLDDSAFAVYAQACAATLARAHGQSGTAAQVAGYAGNGRVLSEAIVDWSYAYAELSRRDYDAYLAANPQPAAS